MSVIRSAGLRGFRAEVEALGGDPLGLARRARLDPAALDADDVLVPDVEIARIGAPARAAPRALRGVADARRTPSLPSRRRLAEHPAETTLADRRPIRAIS